MKKWPEPDGFNEALEVAMQERIEKDSQCKHQAMRIEQARRNCEALINILRMSGEKGDDISAKAKEAFFRNVEILKAESVQV